MNIKAVLKKNTMIIVLVLVYLFFMITTKGSIFFPLICSEIFPSS